MRPFAARGSNAWLMATVAGGIVLDNAVLFTFGKEPRSFPPMLSTTPIKLFGTGVFPLQLVIPLVGLGVAGGAGACCCAGRAAARRCWRWCRTPMRRA